ncbi:MAG TPA: hypothetical protein VNH18_36250 [Bryobacteraceae bacterium]|nr:hypothetical protein [Bryobacteraceae bacterium]
MKLQILSAVSSAVLLTSGLALASSPVIGIASSQGGVTLDNSKVSGNASIFDGSTVQTDSYSRIHMNNGTRLDLGAGSKATVYSNRVSLERGVSEVQSTNGFEVNANSLKISGAEAGAIARVKIEGNKTVYVTALNKPVNVLNKDGLLVARVNPGLPLSFIPQAAGASVFENSGCVLQKSGAAILVDETGNQTFELRGMDLRKVIGSHVKVSGSVDSSAAAKAGASQVVKVSKATLVKKGGCASVAAKVGATTTAAGLAAGAGAAGAGAGAAGAGAAGAGAAAAGAGAAAAGAGAAAAGISTAVVVGGVAAATAAGVGAAAATGSFSSNSP